jgi:hypothetical protein
MNATLKTKALFAFPILLLTFCSSPEKPKAENYHELIQKVIAQDEDYLQAFKKTHEKGWDNNWKLMNSRIDAFEKGNVIKGKDGDKETTARDTNCILEWNYKFGKIRREIYNSNFEVETTEVLYYKNDSVFAQGTLHLLPGSELKLLQITHFRKQLLCKPCNDFSYGDYVSAFVSTGIQYEEYQILDSMNNVMCSYSSPKFSTWHWREKAGDIEMTLYSDTTITTDKTCSFVELKGE